MTDADDQHWLEQALHYARKSKDPSTKVGCVILRPNGTVASMGRNGFPRGIRDDEERLMNREVKNRMTIHAELNALHFALEDLTGATLYATFAPCENCALHIIQRGIARVVFPDSHVNESWRESQERSLALLREARVVITPFKLAEAA
ncbi:dCMP deaminase [Citromicrobium phage vB_CbaS-RXM]|nr:dCMP deaminase [Citromicrobium phage vB_CbaS-RXM]